MNGEWAAGFATRARRALYHLMRADTLDRYEDRRGGSRSGKSCIEYRVTKTLNFEPLNCLIETMLSEAPNPAKQEGTESTELPAG